MGSLQFDGHDTCHVSKNINKTVLQRRCRICCFFSLRNNKKCHSDGNRKAQAWTPNYIEKRKFCIAGTNFCLILGNFQSWWLLDGAQLRQLTSRMSGPYQDLHHILVWSLKNEIRTAKLFCPASARENTSPEEENIIFQSSFSFPAVTGGQLTARASPVLHTGN